MFETQELDTQEERQVDRTEQFMTVFFVFDSVLENSAMESQEALELFKRIQKQTFQ